jgi:hypothetical protein
MSSPTVSATINPSGVVPVYSEVPIVQPGSWISIYGSNFASTTTLWNGNFPTSLGNVSVTIDGKPGYLWFVSPGQINLQAPDAEWLRQICGGAIGQVLVSIGGKPATVIFAGLVGEGLYQLNIVVPQAPSGDQAVQAFLSVNSPILAENVQTQSNIFIPVQ